MKKLSEEELKEISDDVAGGYSSLGQIPKLLDHIAALQSEHQRPMELMGNGHFYIRPVFNSLGAMWTWYKWNGEVWIEHDRLFSTYAEAFDALFIELEKLEEEETS